MYVISYTMIIVLSLFNKRAAVVNQFSLPLVRPVKARAHVIIKRLKNQVCSQGTAP